MEGGNLKYIPKIFSIQQRQSLDSTSLSRLSFANPKEENAESRTFLFLENCPPPVFVSATYTASPRFSSSPGGIPAGLSRKGRTRPFMGCSFGRAATSPDQPATLVRRNWHQGQRWFLSPSLFRRLLLRPVPFEIMLSV